MSRALLVVALFGVAGSSAVGQEKQPAAPAEPAPAQVTFAEHIAPLMHNKCASCHRPGEVGPFPLLSYGDVRKRGKLVKQVIEKRTMPPWHPAPGHGEFANERRLSDAQVALVSRWVEQGMPEGDPAKTPAPPKFPEGWQLGKPDLVVAMDKAFPVPATGRDIYRNFVLPLKLDEDKYVTAIELRPAARSVVHHVLFFTDKTGQARGKDGKDGKPGFTGMLASFARGGSLGGWAAGGQPRHYPMGLGLPLAKGSDLILQTHFHPSGKAEMEKTTVGLYFARKTPERTLVPFQAPAFFGFMAGINIPAGEKSYTIKSKFKAPVDMELLSAGGHAHYVCASMKATATLPDGAKKPLLYLPRWDFNWQDEYLYKEPVKLPKGSVIDVELVYDNSADNPANPFSPPKRIKWGTASTDEMGSIIFNAVAARESEVRQLRSGITSQLINLDGFLKRKKDKQ